VARSSAGTRTAAADLPVSHAVAAPPLCAEPCVRACWPRGPRRGRQIRWNRQGPTQSDQLAAPEVAVVRLVAVVEEPVAVVACTVVSARGVVGPLAAEKAAWPAAAAAAAAAAEQEAAVAKAMRLQR